MPKAQSPSPSRSGKKATTRPRKKSSTKYERGALNLFGNQGMISVPKLSRRFLALGIALFAIISSVLVYITYASTLTQSFWTTEKPGFALSNDSKAVELGLKFRSIKDGYVSGVKFYKGGPANGGLHSGSLWSGNGQRLTTVLFRNETASGWQQAAFPAPVKIAANTDYVISYWAPEGHYSQDVNYFNTTRLKGDLIAQGMDRNVLNGVNSYQGTYPTATYQQSNYYVDVIFNASEPVIKSTPSAVQSLYVDGATYSSLVVRWTAPTNPGASPVTGYKVGWIESGTGRAYQSSPPHFGLTSAPLTLSGLTAGRSYDIRVTAVNASGEGIVSTRTANTLGTAVSTSPTPTQSPLLAKPLPTDTPTTNGTTSVAPMPYPFKSVALYHMMWSNSGSPLLSTTPSNVNVIRMAFAQGDPLKLTGWASDGQVSFVAAAKTLRARGVRMTISVGGAGGYMNTANRQGFVNSIMAINAITPLDGLDWDIEGSAMNQADVLWISTELKRLRGSNFAITMAPNGSNIGEYLPTAVALQNAGALTAIGQQFYDAPVSKEAAMGRIDQAVAAGIPASKYEVGMMIGTTSNYWTVDTCLTNMNYFKAKYPSLRGGYLWEAGRSGTGDWANRIGSIIKQ